MHPPLVFVSYLVVEELRSVALLHLLLFLYTHSKKSLLWNGKIRRKFQFAKSVHWISTEKNENRMLCGRRRIRIRRKIFLKTSREVYALV